MGLGAIRMASATEGRSLVEQWRSALGRAMRPDALPEGARGAAAPEQALCSVSCCVNEAAMHAGSAQLLTAEMAPPVEHATPHYHGQRNTRLSPLSMSAFPPRLRRERGTRFAFRTAGHS